MTKKKVDDVYFQLFCEKNSDGTRHLRLRGREMEQRFGQRLNADDMHALVSFLRKTPTVISVDLAYNNIGDTGLQILAGFFSDPNNLESLNLLHCDVGAEGLKWLSEAEHLHLRTLKLEGNKFGYSGARYVGSIIEKTKTLENLDIGETDQTVESIEAVLIVIETHSSIKNLNISRVIPKSYYSKYSSGLLADNVAILLKLNDTLESLRIQKMEFDGHDVEILIGGLKYHKNLRMLDLGVNRIGDHGGELIAQWLGTGVNLTGLRLPATAITKKSLQLLSLKLPFSKVRYLDIQYNHIDAGGILMLLHSIKKIHQMRMLYIWGNEIKHRVCKYLQDLLKAEILRQDGIDVKIYDVDGVKNAAYYPTNQYVLRSYSVNDFGAPPELKIKRNNIALPTDKPRALVNFEYVDRYPAAKEIEKMVTKKRKSSVDRKGEESTKIFLRESWDHI